jgi:hypothetical protein
MRSCWRQGYRSDELAWPQVEARLQIIWARPDVCRLLADNLGYWQINVGSRPRILSVNLGRKPRCLQVGAPMFAGCYSYLTPRHPMTGARVATPEMSSRQEYALAMMATMSSRAVRCGPPVGTGRFGTGPRILLDSPDVRGFLYPAGVAKTVGDRAWSPSPPERIDLNALGSRRGAGGTDRCDGSRQTRRRRRCR